MTGLGRGAALCASVCISLAGVLDAMAADLAPPSPPRLAARPEPAAGAMSRAKEPDVAWDVLGRSIEGRVIEFAQFGEGKRQVLVVGSLRGNEPEGVALAQSLAVHLSRFPRRIEDVKITIVRDPNPDGRARRTAGNARGVELDRNFQTTGWRKVSEGQRPSSGMSPESEPESRALAELINDIRPDRVIILASGKGRTGVTYSGPAEFLARQVALEAEGQAIPLNDLRATGSLASLAGADRGIPTLQVAVAPRPTADAIWSAHKRALLTAIGCGSPIDFVPVVAKVGPPSVRMQTPTSAPASTPPASPPPASPPEVAANSAPAQQPPIAQPSPQQSLFLPAGDIRPVGTPANNPSQPAAGIPQFPPPQSPLLPVAPPQIAPDVDSNGPQPMPFNELRHGRPAVPVTSPRSARRMRGEPTLATPPPAVPDLPDIGVSDIGPIAPSASASSEHEVSPPPSNPRIQRLPPVNLFAPPRREPTRRESLGREPSRPSAPTAGLPQPPIPFYPQTGY